MSSLLAPRPPGWRMREEDDRQGSLFGGDAFGPPPPRLRAVPQTPPRAVPVEPAAPPALPLESPLASFQAPADAAPASFQAPADTAPAPFEPAADAAIAPPEEADAEIRVSRARRPALDGPTLDDAVSHAWEALVARVPAACPVCHNEIDPAPAGALQGRCRTCDVTLD
jgi:hypothetical protein